MGVPAFYRWLSEKYPKIIEDVLEERVHLASPQSSIRLPFDATKPNPSGLECDNLYIDMNGIIHPCSHPENGPQPTTEEEMYDNVCRYVDRLFRAMRPRKLLYLAIDGVAPRAKMNQQRARRFRSAQEARELKELEENVRTEMEKMGERAPPLKDAWDSNVITPGTPFMLKLADFIRFYIRKRMSTDKAWKNIRVIFSDASIPGEGEHKIMSHIRLQRAQPGYNPNTVHVLHGLDADLIMLALATHEAHFYISREEVLFGRKSIEQQERRQMETGHRDKQKALDENAGQLAMQLPENTGKPLQRVSIPILREYIAAEFESCTTPGRIPFQPSLERLIDDIVFLCFFVGNDFLPHLPSLDIRDGALDFLFNVYKRILPGLGDYITKSGGNVNLSHVDVILAEVGGIEDYVFSMKNENERREKQRREEMNQRRKKQQGHGNSDAPPVVQSSQPKPKVMGRAARILEKQQEEYKLSRGHQAKEDARRQLKVTHMNKDDNLKVAEVLKASLNPAKEESGVQSSATEQEKVEEDAQMKDVALEPGKKGDGVPIEKSEDDGEEEEATAGSKRKHDQIRGEVVKKEVGVVGEAEEEFEDDARDEDDESEDEGAPKIEDMIEVVDPEVAKAFKAKVKAEQQQQLDSYSKNVVDNVRLHEAGWKDRYYTDKCKAEDIEGQGGKEHLFKSYVMGLCWVMKYYYDGVPSWKWYYPFHYAPFASDLKNIERFEKDCRSFDSSKPFNPVEQLMAVLPSDSVHAIPKAARWLMTDPESPVIDFYPRDVPVDPNGKAMPWLWVVLLPFIDEDRLLAALTPTMAKWTKEELFCNARGLDDGYLYIHRSHPLSKKLASVLQSGKTAKAPKTRLTDAASYGCTGFSGSVRPPLSNELYPLEEDVTIPPPPTASKIDQSTHHDALFSDNIELNDAVCVAFTEPSKLSHKSILLPGSRSPPMQLSSEDKRIRRPRLSRGGGTIANLGTSNGQSHSSGHGSMNIGSYERNLAQSTGRSNQMYQAGTRQWGAMEPAPKRLHRGPPPPPMPNPMMNQSRSGPPSHFGSFNRPPWQSQNPNRNPPYGVHAQSPPSQRQAGPRQGNAPGYPPQYQQQQGFNEGAPMYPPPGRGNPPSMGYPPGNFNNRGPPPQQPQRGFNFRSFDQGQQRSGSTQQQQQRSRANANVMNSLRAQLTSTLRQNRGSGGQSGRKN